MTAQPSATGPYSPESASQGTFWHYDTPETPQGHTAPNRKAVGESTTDGRIKQKNGRYMSKRRAASLARRQRKVTRRLYVPVDDLLLEDLALVAKAQGTSIPELARVVLYRGMGLGVMKVWHCLLIGVACTVAMVPFAVVSQMAWWTLAPLFVVYTSGSLFARWAALS